MNKTERAKADGTPDTLREMLFKAGAIVISQSLAWQIIVANLDAAFAAGALAGAKAMQDELAAYCDTHTPGWSAGKIKMGDAPEPPALHDGQVYAAHIRTLDPAAVAQVVTDERNAK